MPAVRMMLAERHDLPSQIVDQRAGDRDEVFGQPVHDEVQRWNLAQDWVISEHPVHEALVSEQDFIAVQAFRAARPTDGDARGYLLSGLLR